MHARQRNTLLHMRLASSSARATALHRRDRRGHIPSKHSQYLRSTCWLMFGTREKRC